MGKRAAVIRWAMLLAASAVSFHGTEAGVGIAAPNAIEGIEWMLIELKSIPVSPLAGERRPFLKLDEEKRQATGFAGCNNFFGGYECDGASLKFGPVGSTRMACPDLQLSLETEFFNALARTRSWRMEEGELVLLDDSQVIARFAMPPGQEGSTGGEPEISGTVWQWVRTLYSDDRKAEPDDPKNYTVQFQEGGILHVEADCNQKGGTYFATTEDRRLSIEITHSTMAACPEGSLEDEFVRGLSAAAIYFIKDGDLYIDLKFDSGTMRFSKPKGK